MGGYQIIDLEGVTLNLASTSSLPQTISVDLEEVKRAITHSNAKPILITNIFIDGTLTSAWGSVLDDIVCFMIPTLTGCYIGYLTATDSVVNFYVSEVGSA